MKKILSAAATAAFLAVSMNAQAQQNVPMSSLDSLSYAIGVAQSQGLQEFFEKQQGVDFGKFAADYLKGLEEGATMQSGTAEHARIMGMQIGMQVAQYMLPQINKSTFESDSTQTLSAAWLIQGMKDALQQKSSLTAQEAMQLADQKVKAIKQERLMREFGANKAEGEAFLKKNLKKKGVKTLEGGVQYKVLVAGKGEMPTEDSEVKVNYEGRTLDGNVFDSSYKRGEATKFKVKSVIKGWQTALKNMPVGSTWEVYIPQEVAYGEQNTGDIKPFSMLIFKIELLEIVK